MSALSDKIRKARESVVSASGFDFTIRRPTDVDMIEFSQHRDSTKLLKFVVGWDKVREMDILPGGDGHPAPFDPEACAEWLADRADLLGVLVTAIIDAYQAHKSRLESAEKN